MSRIGNKIIKFAEGVTINVQENNVVTVKGPKGELTEKFDNNIKIEIEGLEIKVSRPDDSFKMIHGTTRALLNNMVVGVTDGFHKTLLIEGVGYHVELKGNVLVVYAGYSHTVELPVPEGITVSLKSPTELTVSGCDKQVVGQYACEIRAVRKPEPYLGKGIRYSDEIIRRKEGKKAK